MLGNSSDSDLAPVVKIKAKKTINKKDPEAQSIEETQLEHILLRPDTYIGSVEKTTQAMWVFEDKQMVHRSVSFVPGLYKIFDEILVNAADNKVRDPTMDTLKITIDKENSLISVYNNGKGIPIHIHKEEGVYVPELIFGHLLTSSNYNDTQKKVTGGRNGYGAKLANIFSTEFIVETADASTGKKFKQVFSQNMSQKTTPAITENKKKENYTRITFSPDLAKFGMDHFDSDLVALLKKRAYDMAGCVPKISVFLNDEKIKVKTFKSYVDLYIQGNSQKEVLHQRVNDRWEDGQFNQVSFVNSINTSKGGTHVAYVTDQLVTALLDATKKKDKKAVQLKPHQVKSHLWVFINCLIENPSFDSQTKENMTLRASAFGSKCALDDDFMKKVLKCGILESIMSFAQLKQQQALKKTDGKKSTRITGIAKLDDANNAGTRNGSQCTLILTEGDSAKSLAVSGLGVIGRDNYGVFPLRGKLLNVREATHAQIMNNAEISAIKQIIGLQTGKVYTDTSSLRYGHIMIMTDQDHDGSHIKGLIINFLDHFWPSLLKVPKFLLEFITPIVKVTKKKQEVSFFTLPEYETWKEENNDGKGWTIKYYKGLGTSSTEDAKKYFANLPFHVKEFKPCNQNERELVDMAFNKKKADDRKEWLRQFLPGTFMDHAASKLSIEDFINRELILFSMADNARSIPSVVDGLKPGHRKILFASFKRNLVSEIKVAQFAGYVSEHSAYHHGEQSLCTTIVGMAQNFVGSNNLPLLEPLGQFGTRLQGGKDSASPRYIFTKLAPLARAIFHPSDDALLTYLTDDGQSIEPEWYIPIIPLVLVYDISKAVMDQTESALDGVLQSQISSLLVTYASPRDIVANLYALMESREPEPLHPWYRGFTGTTVAMPKGGYKLTGTIRKIDELTVEITELPLRTWTQSFKEQLEEWITGTPKTPAWIADYKEYHTDSRVHFVVSLVSADEMKKAEAEGLEKRFKLSTSIATSNIVCFDLQGRIRKYESANVILTEFYNLRLQYYQKRRDHLIQQLRMEWSKLENKCRFITEIVDGTLVVSNRKKQELLAELKKRGYEQFFKKEEEQGEGYDYLFSMSIWNLTMEKVEALVKEKEQKQLELDLLSRQTPKDLWRTDLDAFLVKWEAFEELMKENESAQAPGVGGARKGGKKAGKKVDDDDFDFKKGVCMRLPAAPIKKPIKKVVDDISEISRAVSDIKIETKPVVKKRIIRKAPVAKAVEPFVKVESEEAKPMVKAIAASDSDSELKPVVKATKSKAIIISDSEDEPAAKPSAKTAAKSSIMKAAAKLTAKKIKPPVVSESEEEEFTLSDEKEPLSRAAKRANQVVQSDDSDDDMDETRSSAGSESDAKPIQTVVRMKSATIQHSNAESTSLKKAAAKVGAVKQIKKSPHKVVHDDRVNALDSRIKRAPPKKSKYVYEDSEEETEEEDESEASFEISADEE